MKTILLPGAHERADEKLIEIDAAQLDTLSARQMLIRADHRGLAEFPIDPSRPEIRIEGSVLAFNPEVKHDEAVGLKIVGLGSDGSRNPLAVQKDTDGASAVLQEGSPFGVYLFTLTPGTAGVSSRLDDVFYKDGRMVQVRGVRRRSLVCAVRFGDLPIASDQNGELPVPLMVQKQGFPRTYLQNRKRQTPGILLPGVDGGYEQDIKVTSEPLVFGKNVPDGTPLTVAVLEYVEHDGLETSPADMRPRVVDLLRGTVDLQARPAVQPADFATLQTPQKRLITAMKLTLRKAAKKQEVPT